MTFDTALAGSGIAAASNTQYNAVRFMTVSGSCCSWVNWPVVQPSAAGAQGGAVPRPVRGSGA